MRELDKIIEQIRDEETEKYNCDKPVDTRTPIRKVLDMYPNGEALSNDLGDVLIYGSLYHADRAAYYFRAVLESLEDGATESIVAEIIGHKVIASVRAFGEGIE
jgi:hypothetical protein